MIETNYSTFTQLSLYVTVTDHCDYCQANYRHLLLVKTTWNEDFAGNHLYQYGMNFQQFIAFHHCESFVTYTASLAFVDDIMDWFSSMPGNN